MSQSGVKVLDAALLVALSGEARNSPRLRQNYNLHPGDESACHRFFNAVEPGTYIRPHRHLAPEKDETLIVVKGTLGVLAFDSGGAVTGSYLLRPGGTFGVDIPHGEYHTAISLETGTVFLEAKAGPYLPLSEGEKADFAPAEGAPEAAAYLEGLSALFR